MKETGHKNPSYAYWDENNLDSEVMKHSKSPVLLSCDFGTASNSRWRVIKMIAGKCSALRDIVGKESELVEKI
ncbi:hypothetical protein NC653_040906 [Populus alba x Populus x berolinensis]|uniref:Uncharacterized protein n=1 Tax=Populus alba x Populus x berolinensis TaxID=444605 RepID=A0AAD6L765_9ROSI|nr:hypothetical protein NC653_040906 [Populus alba x Populus x berolinensis]